MVNIWGSSLSLSDRARVIAASGDNALKKWVSYHNVLSLLPLADNICLYMKLKGEARLDPPPATGYSTPTCDSTDWSLSCCRSTRCCPRSSTHAGGSSQTSASDCTPGGSPGSSDSSSAPSSTSSNLRSPCFNFLSLPRRSLPLLLKCILASFCRLLSLDCLVFNIGYILSGALPVGVEN